jgi:endonuclease/exonuclease/phosphatase family metal-dependent hydrolase
VRVTTLNLQQFTDWETRQPRIVDYLRETSPDVVLFQEAVFLPDISPFNQAQLINQTLEYPYMHSAITRLQPSAQHETYREGLAALSRHAVIQSDTLILKQAPEDEHNRIVQLLDLELGGRTMKLANVHFSLTDTTDFATAHLKETLGILAMRGEERVIAGDFNLDNLEVLVDIWGDRYRCSTEADYITFPSMDKRVDYFLIPKSHSFADISTSDDTLSDHRAVTVDIELGT